MLFRWTRILCMFAAITFAAAVTYAQEMRMATIAVYEDINDTVAIQNWVNSISSMKYNAVTVHTRFRGDATYFPNKTNSTYPNPEPRNAAAGSIDVLQEFITRGQAKGLKVFAYVNVFLVTDGSNVSTNPNHPVNAHNDWISYAYNGGSPRKMTLADDPEGLWLDPGIPAVRTYNTNVVADIVANYPALDGVIIDRIRYSQTAFTRANKDFGYHPTAIAAYNAANGTSGTPSPSSTTWQAWRRTQVNAQVQQIYTAATAIKPGLIVMAFPIGRLSDAINFNYQDWPAWMNGGYIDGCFVQLYRTTNADFTTACNEHIAAYTGTRLFGVATKCWIAGMDITGQIGITRTKGFDGTAPFRHVDILNQGYTSQLTTAYATAATWPAMPWKVPTTYIVDNTDAGFAASTNWFATTSTPGYYGTNYRARSTASISDSAAWSVNLPTSGSYKVYVRYPAGANRAASAPFQVVHSGGTTTVNVNQQANNNTWVLLGTYNFNSGNAVRVRLSCWTTAGFYVIADAIKLEKQ